MPVYLFNPAYDRIIGAGWVNNPFTADTWDKVNGGPGLDNESVDHTAFSYGHNGTTFEVAFPDVTPTADAMAHFGTPRVYAVRLAMRASMIEAGARMQVYLAIFGSFGSGIPAVPVDSSIVYVPGSPSVQTIAGAGFLEYIEAYRTPWSLHKNDGTDWTAADLNSSVAQIAGWGQLRFYEVWLEVDMQLSPFVMAGEPHYPNQKIGQFQPISWRFNNAGNGVQKKYQVRIFTAAQYAAGGAGVNTWTKTCTLDSQIVESSKGYHDFGSKVGSKFIQGIADGTWTVAIRAAKDWKGGDWWSPDYVQTFIVGSPGTVTITNPSSSSVLYGISRPAFTLTTTVASGDERQSEWRVYAKPTAGFPSDFDPDLTDLEPAWSGFAGGSANTLRPDLEDSLRNGLYRIYARVQEVDFNDWTPWASCDFEVGVTSQPPPTLVITPDPANARMAYELDFMYSSNAWDMRAIYLTRTSQDNEPTPVRLATPDTAHGLLPDSHYFSGAAFTNLAKANSSSLHPGIALDIAVEVRPPDWTSHATTTVAARWNDFTVDFRSWLFILRSDNKLELRWSTNGLSGTVVTQVSTVALPAIPNGDFRWLRAKLSYGSPYNLTFQYSSDGNTWTTLGSVIVGAGATSIFNSTTNGYLEFGSHDNGLAGYAPLFFRGYRQRASIDDTVDTLAFKAYGSLKPIGQGVNVNGAGTVYHFHIEDYDQEIPFNKSTTYSAYYKSYDEADDEYAWSDSVTSSPYTMAKNETWLRVIDDPSLSRRVLSADSWQQIESGNVRSSSRALGRTMPIVQRGVGRGDTFNFGFTVIGEDNNENLVNALDSGSKLLLTTPKRQWYCEVIGAYNTKSRIYDSRYGDEDTRFVQVPFIEVEPY